MFFFWNVKFTFYCCALHWVEVKITTTTWWCHVEAAVKDMECFFFTFIFSALSISLIYLSLFQLFLIAYLNVFIALLHLTLREMRKTYTSVAHNCLFLCSCFLSLCLLFFLSLSLSLYLSLFLPPALVHMNFYSIFSFSNSN